MRRKMRELELEELMSPEEIIEEIRRTNPEFFCEDYKEFIPNEYEITAKDDFGSYDFIIDPNDYILVRS